MSYPGRAAYLPIAKVLGVPVRWWHPAWLIRRRTFAAIVERRPDLIAYVLRVTRGAA